VLGIFRPKVAFLFKLESKMSGMFFETQCRVLGAAHGEDFVILACTVLV